MLFQAKSGQVVLLETIQRFQSVIYLCFDSVFFYISPSFMVLQ